MKLYSVTDKEFAKYGRVLEGYDFSDMFAIAESFPIQAGFVYKPSIPELESCAAAQDMCLRGFGGMPIQIGYVAGINGRLDCLEYHKSSEFNIAKEDAILVLGTVPEMDGFSFDTANCKAFLVPAGTGVELYGTTLHYAPFGVNGAGYRVLCVLPRGTNGPKPALENKDAEALLCCGTNKWLVCHPDVAAENPNVYVGLRGKNITDADITE